MLPTACQPHPRRWSGLLESASPNCTKTYDTIPRHVVLRYDTVPRQTTTGPPQSAVSASHGSIKAPNPTHTRGKARASARVRELAGQDRMIEAQAEGAFARAISTDPTRPSSYPCQPSSTLTPTAARSRENSRAKQRPAGTNAAQVRVRNAKPHRQAATAVETRWRGAPHEDQQAERQVQVTANNLRVHSHS